MSQCDTCAIARHKCSQRPGAGPNSPCERCHEHHLTCQRESDRYHTALARRLAAGRKAAELAERREAAPSARRARRARRARPSPANAEAGPSSQRLSPEFHDSWDTRFDTPGPTFDVLVGGSGGLDSAGASLFWRSELSRAEGLALAANRHEEFARKMLRVALGNRRIVPPDDGSDPKRVRFTGGKGKGMASAEEGVISGKGKGRAKPPAKPMDQDDEDNAAGQQ